MAIFPFTERGMEREEVVRKRPAKSFSPFRHPKEAPPAGLSDSLPTVAATEDVFITRNGRTVAELNYPNYFAMG